MGIVEPGQSKDDSWFCGGGRGTYVLYKIAIFLWPHERFLRAAISASLLRKAISPRPLFFFWVCQRKCREYEYCGI